MQTATALLLLSFTLLGCRGPKDFASLAAEPARPWTLASDLSVERQDRGGFRDLFAGDLRLTVGGGLYIVASCTGLDDRVTNLISTAGTGFLAVNEPSGGPSACGNPAYRVVVEGTNPLTVTYRVAQFTSAVGIVNFTLDLSKMLTPAFGFLHAERRIEEGCADDWRPIARDKSQVAAIRAPCIIPGGVGAVGVARQPPPLSGGTEAFLGGPDVRVDLRVDRVTVRDPAGELVDTASAPFVSDFGVYNHPGTNAFGSAFYGVPSGYSIELVETLTVTTPARD